MKCNILRQTGCDINFASESDCKNIENVDTETEMDYILQTNIDHWSYCNYDDLGKKNKKKKAKNRNKNKNKNKKKRKMIEHDTMDSISRLNIGHKCLKEMKGNLNEHEMWKLLYQYPIHDKNWTIFTTVINVKSGYYKTIRHIYK